MAVQGLIILNSAKFGQRDLWWVDDPSPTVIGYNVYRAVDYPTNWTKVNREIIPGHLYRDQTFLQEHVYTIQDSDWVERGEAGRYIFKVPEAPIYSEVLDGRPGVASHPSDVVMWVDGVRQDPARVEGLEGAVWLQQTVILRKDGDHRERPLIKNPSTSEVKVQYKTLANYVEPWLGGTRTFYSVVPVLDNGTEAHEPGAPATEIVDTLQIDKMDYMQAEMVRRNAWLFEQPGEPAHLMFRRTKGKSCSCINQGQARTGCEICYETGIVGGYYGPIDIIFLDPDTAVTTTVEENGRKVERVSKSYLGPSPVVQAGDLVVRRNGERLVIANPVYKMPRGVLLQQEFDVELLNLGDTRYKIPVVPLGAPIVFNPAFGTGTEPVSDPRTDPTKQRESSIVPIGRSTTFGRIMS